jgi:two-component system response regulator NreC
MALVRSDRTVTEAPMVTHVKDEPPAPADSISIVLVDDHEVVRKGLRMVLEAEDRLEVIAEAGDLETARRYVGAHRPRVLVLDVNLPEGSSLPAIPELREQSRETAVVVLTMQQDIAFAREAMRAGAVGYVLKHSAGSELVDAVCAAAAGETYLNPKLGAQLAAAPAEATRPPDGLTEREVEILRLIGLGHTNIEVAEQLCLSVPTVESHRAHIPHKTGQKSRSELVRYALDHGLFE